MDGLVPSCLIFKQENWMLSGIQVLYLHSLLPLPLLPHVYTHTPKVAAWLGSSEDAPALEYSIDESHRPVRLRRVVLGYPDANSEFKFDFSLNYRLSGVIQCYSDQKPTLVVCVCVMSIEREGVVLSNCFPSSVPPEKELNRLLTF